VCTGLKWLKIGSNDGHELCDKSSCSIKGGNLYLNENQLLKRYSAPLSYSSVYIFSVII
jgi:hypothetical protein